MKNLIIIGARGFGRVVYNIAAACIQAGAELQIKGFLDDKKDALVGYDGYPPILSSVEDYHIEEHDVFVCALGDVKPKQMYVQKILDKGGDFITLVSPHADVMMNVHLGKGCIVGVGTNIGCDTTIGDFVTILGHAVVGHDVVVEKWAHIGAKTFIGGNAKIEEGATMQTGAILVPKKTIGKNATVGAGSVVIRNVKEGITVFGNPAQII